MNVLLSIQEATVVFAVKDGTDLATVKSVIMSTLH